MRGLTAYVGYQNQRESVMRKPTWKQTCKLANSDETLRLLAGAIHASNAARMPDRTAYLAFRDRATEIGVVVPNEAYWSMLLWAIK